MANEHSDQSSVPLTSAQLLERASDRLTDYWFPIDPAVLDQVKESLQEGRYTGNRNQLFEDLKQDYSLFAYCLRKLFQLASDRGEELNLETCFVTLPLEEFEKVLNVSTFDVSFHQLEKATAHQHSRTTSAVISASVAEALAESHDLHSHVAYSCGLLRQLGHTLISWNYPNVYKAAMENAKTANEVDEIINRTLGFSPRVLGVTLARRWKVSASLRGAIGDKEVLETFAPDSKEERLASSLERICVLGETLARVQDPTFARQGRGNWADALSQIEDKIGVDGLDEIFKTITKNSARFIRTASESPDWSVVPSDSGVIIVPKLDTKTNPYLKHCPLPLREELQNIYTLINEAVPCEKLLEELVKAIMPGSGFPRGCIYLLDPDLTTTLVPRLVIGEHNLKEFKSAPIVGRTSGNPVTSAYKMRIPILDKLESSPHKLNYFIAGVLGDQQKAGVLYLETTALVAEHSRWNPIISFKAIREVVTDCLNVR